MRFHFCDMHPFVTADHLGSTRMLMSAAGAVTQRRDYSPYGEEMATAGRSSALGYAVGQDPRVKFTGHYRDNKTDLDYFGARFFWAKQGRFVSADPKTFPGAMDDPQSWNKYGYVRNNPLRLVDPDGEDWKDILSGIGNAYSSNQFLGLGRSNGGNSDFQKGQAVGDAITVVAGLKQMFDGASIIVASGFGEVASAGMATPAALPAAVFGTVYGAHGVAAGGTGLKNLATALNQTGSYTNTHESGNTYDGKGSKERSQTSCKEKAAEHNDPHVATDWKPAKNSREAMKDESRRLQSNDGPGSPNNYNKIESPGKKYRKQDGTP